MTHEARLAQMIEQHGSFEDIPWGTMFGNVLTLGEMTDSHVMNSLHHHYGMQYVLLGQIGYLNRPDDDNDMDEWLLSMNLNVMYAQLESCRFNEYLMREIQRRRGTEENAENH